MKAVRRRLRPLARWLRAFHSTRRNWLLDFDLAAPPEAPAAVGEVRFRAATSRDVDGLLASPDQELHSAAAQRHRALFESGEPFFVGVLDSRIVYRAWAVLKAWRIAGPHHLRMGRGKACVLGCFTVADMRGRGIYPAALRAQLALLRESGVRRCFINVEQDNLASLRGIRKAGFRTLGEYEVRRRFGRVRLIMDRELRQAIESDWPG